MIDYYFRSHLEAGKLLVENGADFNAKTAGDGGTVLWCARTARIMIP